MSFYAHSLEFTSQTKNMYVELHPDNLAFLSYQYPVGFRINTSQLVEYNILKDWYPAEDAAVFFTEAINLHLESVSILLILKIILYKKFNPF